MNVKELGRQEQNWERSDLVALNATNTAELGAQRPGRVECHKRSRTGSVATWCRGIPQTQQNGERSDLVAWNRVKCLDKQTA